MPQIKKKVKSTSQKAKPPLRCPHCKTGLTITQVLDASELCWPNKDWIGYDCPKCKVFSHAKLSETALALGELDGFPGPALIVSSRCTLSKVSVSWSEDGVKLKYGKTNKIVPARK